MKLRGINPIELHVEKLFLVLMALVLFGVLTMQFVGGGNTIKVGSEDNVPIDMAGSRVAARAQQQLAQMLDENPAAQVARPPQQAAATFAQKLQTPVALRNSLPGPLGMSTGADLSGIAAVSPDQVLRLSIPPLPAPSAPAVTVFGGALDPLLVAQLSNLSELAPWLPTEQPFDVQAVSIESTFDASTLVATLRADPAPGAAHHRIPELWWSSVLEIVDVEVWRQEVYPDGAAGPEELLPPLPGRASLRGQLAAVDQLGALRITAQRARDDARTLLKPRFYRMIAGEAWTPPTMAAQFAQQMGETDRLRHNYRRLSQSIEQLQRRLEDLGRQTAAPSSTRSPFDGYSAQVGVGGGGGGAQPAGRESRDPAATRDAGIRVRREQLERQIREATEQQSRIGDRLRELGFDPARGGALSDPGEDAIAEPMGRLRDGASVRFWAHDISARPGTTYRYRTRIVLPNPLFGQGQHLSDDTRSLATDAFLRTPFSPWSAPVSVDLDSYLFITQANRPVAAVTRGASTPVATAEVFRFFYGYWRSDRVQLEPGDAVTGALQLDRLNLPLFQIEAGPDGPREVGQVAIEGALPFDVEGWYLLDVVEPVMRAAAGSARRDELQAVLRSQTGEIVVRRPDQDRVSDRLVRLQRSASAAQDGVVLTPLGLVREDQRAGTAGQSGVPGQAPRPGAQEPTEDRDGRPSMPGGGGVGVGGM